MHRYALSTVRAAALTAILFFAAHSFAADRMHVVATLFPQYDFARIIAGDHARVTLLLPPGAEAHSFEPTPTAMKTIADADVFIYTGQYMEPWAKRLVDAADNLGAVHVVDASSGLDLARTEFRHEHDHADDDHRHDHDESHSHEYDPHIWTDPVFAASMADAIADGMAAADPDNAATYRANGKALRESLLALHRDFAAVVQSSPRRALVFGERFAFGYFFRRYGLEAVGAYKSCAPGAEPGLKAVIEVVDYVKTDNVNYIYLEAMATSRISDVIRQETGASILTVDSLHNPPAAVQNNGGSYLSIMHDNMAAFAKGLAE